MFINICMDYKKEMNQKRREINHMRKKLNKLIYEYEDNRTRWIKRAIRDFFIDWKKNLNPFKFKIWKAKRRLQKQMHEYVKLCGKPM